MRRATTLVCVLAALSLCSCLPVPLGDPEKAAVDNKYVGAWTWADGTYANVVVIRPWDGRTYVVDALTYSGDLTAPTPKMRTTYKGWLHTVKGHPFITLQPIDNLGEDKRKFLVAMLTLEGDQLTATGLDPAYPKFKDVGTATDLEKVVAEQFDDVKMWAKPIVATKLTDAAAPQIEKLTKLFENR